MACRTDTLPHFLTDVADAIRTKAGTSDTIQASAFDTAIANIPSGGGGEPEEKDVNFYDYDGTRLYSYTAQEFQALSAMPENPTHTGLTSQGWNWTLSDAKTYVTSHGMLDIGQMYITDDNATRIYIKLYDGRLSPTLKFALNGTTTIDWGDNTTSSVTGSSSVTLISTQHTYTNAGDYVISIAGTVSISFGGYSSSDALIGSNSAYQNSVQKIELGNVYTIYNYAFKGFYSMTSITIPSTSNNIQSMPTEVFSDCRSLKNIVIQNGTQSIGDYAFSSCSSLKRVIMPKGINSIQMGAFNGSSVSNIMIPNDNISMNNYMFNGCDLLKNVILPNSMTSIGSNLFSGNYSLSTVTIPNNVTSIESSAFSSCYSLVSLKIPSGVTSIGNYAFRYCYSLVYLDFSEHSSIPTLATSTVFNSASSDYKIIVPDNLYSTWVATNYWSNISSHIISKSDWDALQSA